MHIYFISGIGADERMFSKLKLAAGSYTFLPWLKPLPQETMQSYAIRMCQKIQHKEFALVGLSFGGMIAMEMARIVEVKKLILLSSAACYAHLPWWIRIAGKLQLHKLVPSYFLHNTNFLMYRIFGATTKDAKQLLAATMKEADTILLQWSMNAIVTWRQQAPLPYMAIHGTKDRLLPQPLHRINFCIEQCGHLMVFCNAEQVSELIIKALDTDI
ncbi:MAG: hypothetical protein RL660_1399 [Bacteroidota bacterium]|jgi:pimeloyl-ACP methyl ester carboxylesterase